MAIDETQIRLVRESLPLVRERLVPASLDFYENLFAVAPELRPLFRTDLASLGLDRAPNHRTGHHFAYRFEFAPG